MLATLVAKTTSRTHDRTLFRQQCASSSHTAQAATSCQERNQHLTYLLARVLPPCDAAVLKEDMAFGASFRCRNTTHART